MKILLTGATGWIGSHVARQLVDRGHEVHCTVRMTSDLGRLEGILSRIRIHEAPLDFAPIEAEVLVHLAWYTDPDKYLQAPENEECYLASKRLIGQVGCRVVAAGTCFEYDTQLGRLSESSPLKPLTVYSRCKNALREHLESRPNSVWLRVFYQYGPYEHPHRQIPSVIRKLLEGREIPLSPGGQQKDFLHVEDVASAVVAIAESKLEGPLNIGSGSATSQRLMLSILGHCSNRPGLLKFGELPYHQNEPMLIEADNTRLKSTGWTPKWSIQAGLEQTFNWWKNAGSR